MCDLDAGDLLEIDLFDHASFRPTLAMKSVRPLTANVLRRDDFLSMASSVLLEDKAAGQQLLAAAE